MSDAPAPSPRDPLRPTEAEVEIVFGSTLPGHMDCSCIAIRAAYALALPRLIPLLVAGLPDEMMLTAADREEHQRQENEALSAGCETGEIAAVMRRVTAAVIAERRDDLVIALLAAAARLTGDR